MAVKRAAAQVFTHKITPAIDSREMTEADMHRYIRGFMEYVGDDSARPSLAETPERVVRSWDKLFGGYRQDAKDIFKLFECAKNNDIVMLRNIEFYSTCEHHLLPFFGEMHIGYIPDGKITGISKLARLVELHARRLQLQERLVSDIADDIEKYLSPSGVIVTAQAQHFCMTSRGVQKLRSKMVTTAARGLLKEPARRAEFFGLLKI